MRGVYNIDMEAWDQGLVLLTLGTSTSNSIMSDEPKPTQELGPV